MHHYTLDINFVPLLAGYKTENEPPPSRTSGKSTQYQVERILRSCPKAFWLPFQSPYYETVKNINENQHFVNVLHRFLLQFLQKKFCNQRGKFHDSSDLLCVCVCVCV